VTRLRPPTDAELERRWPHLRWREPVIFAVHGGGLAFCCRFCALAGAMRGDDASTLPRSRAAYDRHMRELHPG
jgi:hypothetical protein